MEWYFCVSNDALHSALFSLDVVYLVSMGDLQQLEQDFYQTRYYVDDQGHTVAHCDAYDSSNPAFYD